MAKEESIYFHPGIYRFSFPYLGANFVRNEENEVKVFDCDVELRVGQEKDMKDGKLVVVVISDRPQTPGVQNSFEHIATKVRIAFFDSIFIEKHWEKTIVPEHRIRWIERHPAGAHIGEETNEVTMKWDEKRHVYTSPSWTRIGEFE